MKRSRQAAGGFVKRQRVDPVGVLLNRLTRLPIEIFSQILRIATVQPALDYDPRFASTQASRRRKRVYRGWSGTERMRGYNYDSVTQRLRDRNYLWQIDANSYQYNYGFRRILTNIGTKIRVYMDNPDP